MYQLMTYAHTSLNLLLCEALTDILREYEPDAVNVTLFCSMRGGIEKVFIVKIHSL